MCITCGCNTDHQTDPKTKHEDTHKHRETLSIEQKVLRKNDHIAEHNRTFFQDHNLLCINLLSSPGSGKTTLLERTLTTNTLANNSYVIEGDQHTDQDAQRIRATGASAVQINTGKGCHLSAHHIHNGLEQLNFANNFGMVFIENVGNLVCPASFDLGEQKKVVVLSVTEGDDKPIKYPDMFFVADLVIINKVDLLPYVDFCVDTCISHAHSINPSLEVIELSSTTGEGFKQWITWLEDQKI